MNPTSIREVREDCSKSVAGRAEQLAGLRDSCLVVTGGTGFAGSWLAEMVALLNDDHGFKTRLVLVSRSTDLFKAKRPHLGNRSDLTLVKADVRHLAEIPRETNWLIHAAANPDSRFHASQPIETLSTITEGTASVLRTLDRCSNFKQVLHLSSSQVYGAQANDFERVPESALGSLNCASVSSAYAEAKRCAETLCAAGRSQARIPITVARPFAFMGPYQSLDTPWAASNFIHDALIASPIRVLGDGQTVRSYLYGADMAFAYLRQLTAAAPGSIYNVGSPEGIRVSELAQKIADACNPRPEIRLRTSPGPAVSNRSVPDMRAAETDLGFKPAFSLDQSLERTLRWNQGELR